VLANERQVEQRPAHVRKQGPETEGEHETDRPVRRLPAVKQEDRRPEGPAQRQDLE
jgi:hypothetical protein